jgi:hypothetical protein
MPTVRQMAVTSVPRFASAMVTAASVGENKHIPVPAWPPTSSGSDPHPRIS